MASAPYAGFLLSLFVMALSWFGGEEVGGRLMDRGPAHYAQNQAKDDSSRWSVPNPGLLHLLLIAHAASSNTDQHELRVAAQLFYAIILLWAGSLMGSMPIAENGMALHTRQHATAYTCTLCHRFPLGGYCRWTCAAPKWLYILVSLHTHRICC